ncbi:hypothetical protein [Sphingomonas sanxanigenens]|uniref:hypothetical protein n=1 Tax=Sphingomonas sanxanigenens TaxID=397260 RepID=UPI000A025373|nr:hypothetical protein [Sphingomonas sanxanigenens]
MTLLREIERHLRATSTSATRFGREALGDPRLVHDLRAGREPRPATVARVRAFIAGHQPLEVTPPAPAPLPLLPGSEPC